MKLQEKQIKKILFGALLGISLTAVAQEAVPTDTVTAETAKGSVLPLPASLDWWKGFNDPLLDSLINLGESNNYSLRQSLRRIEVARQSVIQARGGYYPQLSMSAGWSRQRSSGFSMKAPSPAATSGAFALGLDMSWEIDIFGRVRSRTKEAQANERMSAAEFAAMQLSIGAEIASDYISLRTLQREFEVISEHILQQEKVLKITEARHEAGLASMLDVAQARTTFYSTKASLSNIETQIVTTINAIAVLTGKYPEEISGLLSDPQPQPNADWIISTEIPIEVIRNRPDVLEAEYNIDSYTAALGVAKKDYLPTLSLSASGGTSAWNIKDMFKHDSFTYSIAPTLEWTIFDGFIRKAEVAAAKEQLLIAVDSYNETLLTAVQEVDNAMFTYVQALKYEQEIALVLKNAELAYELAIDRYKQGLDAFINVSDAEMTVLEYANEMVQARGSTLQAIVSIAKATGGLNAER